jgi:hypothetical protein
MVSKGDKMHFPECTLVGGTGFVDSDDECVQVDAPAQAQEATLNVQLSTTAQRAAIEAQWKADHNAKRVRLEEIRLTQLRENMVQNNAEITRLQQFDADQEEQRRRDQFWAMPALLNLIGIMCELLQHAKYRVFIAGIFVYRNAAAVLGTKSLVLSMTVLLKGDFAES